MPIIDIDNLPPRRPRLGVIKLGVKDPERGYPKKTDYFVLPEDLKKLYGGKPKILPVYFNFSDLEKVFPRDLKMYGKSRGLKCFGDCEFAHRRDDKTMQFEDIPCLFLKCEHWEKKHCKRVAVLQFSLIGYEAYGDVHIYTTSKNSMLNIDTFLKDPEHAGYKYVPFALILQPGKGMDDKGAKTNIFTMRLDYLMSMDNTKFLIEYFRSNPKLLHSYITGILQKQMEFIAQTKYDPTQYINKYKEIINTQIEADRADPEHPFHIFEKYLKQVHLEKLKAKLRDAQFKELPPAPTPEPEEETKELPSQEPPPEHPDHPSRLLFDQETFDKEAEDDKPITEEENADPEPVPEEIIEEPQEEEANGEEPILEDPIEDPEPEPAPMIEDDMEEANGSVHKAWESASEQKPNNENTHARSESDLGGGKEQENEENPVTLEDIKLFISQCAIPQKDAHEILKAAKGNFKLALQYMVEFKTKGHYQIKPESSPTVVTLDSSGKPIKDITPIPLDYIKKENTKVRETRNSKPETVNDDYEGYL